MRFATVALAASITCGLSLAAQSPTTQSASRDTRELTDVFPGDPKVDAFALTADEHRTYYTANNGEVWMYDRTQKSKTRVTAGPVWDLNLSSAGDAIAYTKAGARRGDTFVWVLALDPKTGLASGAERQLSPRQGDAPSISPDGKTVAFARDDASGVGQSIVVVPLKGGTERVVVANLPSSLANIRWTPDSKTLFFGVNPPVACVPEWSCLPLTQDLRQPPGTIRRVAVSGGAVTTVATGRSLAPGLSPDGMTLMYLDIGNTRQWVIANADGTRRDTLALPASESPVGWLRGSTVAIAATGGVKRFYSMSLADGQPRTR
jgi:Tol biopolymer transport system component